MPTKKQSASKKTSSKKTSAKKESFKVKGDQLVDFVKKAFQEGNLRRIIIKDGNGKVYMEIPVTIGVIGFLVAPILVAVGALAAMVGVFEVELVRRK